MVLLYDGDFCLSSMIVENKNFLLLAGKKALLDYGMTKMIVLLTRMQKTNLQSYV